MTSPPNVTYQSYVTTAEFNAHPTFLDVLNLRSGDSSFVDQTKELDNLLLTASAWADDYCNQPLGAHVRTDLTEASVNRRGELSVHADHNPVIQVTGFAYGYTPTALTSLTSVANVVPVDGRQIVAYLSGGFGPWSGALQFGSPATGQRMWVQSTYVAGWVSTRLAADTAVGALQIQVTDPTGIMPGSRLRIWQPGGEEQLTVAAGYTTGSATVPLTTATLFAHTADAGVSGMPANMRLAVINYAVSLLMRPDTAAEDTYPDARVASGTRIADPRKDGSGLVAEAQRLLGSFRRIR